MRLTASGSGAPWVGGAPDGAAVAITRATVRAGLGTARGTAIGGAITGAIDPAATADAVEQLREAVMGKARHHGAAPDVSPAGEFTRAFLAALREAGKPVTLFFGACERTSGSWTAGCVTCSPGVTETSPPTSSRWLRADDHSIPVHGRLTSGSWPTCRCSPYAWEIAPGGEWEYHVTDGGEWYGWGVPLGRRDHDHPLLGKVLVEQRNGREVQVLQDYADRWRTLDV